MGEVVKNGKNGFLVPVRDSDSMAILIKKFNGLDEKSKLTIIQNAKETIINNHLLSNQIDQFSIIYKNIV